VSGRVHAARHPRRRAENRRDDQKQPRQQRHRAKAW
jgi:hypothetical protein